jgi:hypothetical protein
MGWDAWTAVGTLSLAVTTFVAVVVTVFHRARPATR